MPFKYGQWPTHVSTTSMASPSMSQHPLSDDVRDKLKRFKITNKKLESWMQMPRTAALSDDDYEAWRTDMLSMKDEDGNPLIEEITRFTIRIPRSEGQHSR